MPFCPKCKYEFVDGIKKCNTCGCDLVEQLEEEEQVVAEKISETIDEKLGEESENSSKEDMEDNAIMLEGDDQFSLQNEEDEYSQFEGKATTYQKLSEKYEDIKSSAYTLVLVGGVGLFVMILEWIDVIKFPISIQTKWLFNSVLGGIFIIFLVAGVVSFMHAKKVKIDADMEEELIAQIQQYVEENLSKEIIDKDINTEDSIEILYFNRAEVIKNILMHEFENADEELIDDLVEEFYQKIYE